MLPSEIEALGWTWLCIFENAFQKSAGTFFEGRVPSTRSGLTAIWRSGNKKAVV